MSCPQQWDLSPKKAVALQRELNQQVVVKPLPTRFAVLGAADTAYLQNSRQLVAALVTFHWPDLQLSESVHAVCTIRFPYIPGLLSFREVFRACWRPTGNCDGLRMSSCAMVRGWPIHASLAWLVISACAWILQRWVAPKSVCAGNTARWSCGAGSTRPCISTMKHWDMCTVPGTESNPFTFRRGIWPTWRVPGSSSAAAWDATACRNPSVTPINWPRDCAANCSKTFQNGPQQSTRRSQSPTHSRKSDVCPALSRDIPPKLRIIQGGSCRRPFSSAGRLRCPTPRLARGLSSPFVDP